VLEFSNRNTIALAEELDLLRLYIDLENIRSESSFNYTLEIQEGVDIQNYEVHSMLLQPFVENSIIHGIQNKAKLAEQEKKSYHGELKIVLMLSEGSLKCIIEDNGVGIEKAIEIKNNKSFNHLSLGMRITKDRLDLIGERISKLEYIDLKDENGNSAGTLVEILIPLFERF
jgi:LytS/YehU family sensor histidine kinase